MADGGLKVVANGEREIVMTRTFNAPRRLVWDAHTKPELVKRWLLGPDGWTMPVCEIDLRVGGRYRYVWRREKDGTEMGLSGVYREIASPERIINTERFDEAWYSGEALDTLILVEENGKTLLTQTMLLETREERDKVLKSGMESGVARSYDRLEEILASEGAGARKGAGAP